MVRAGVWVLVGALLACAAYELALALDDPTTPANAAAAIGYLAILAACGFVFARTRAAALLAPAAALFVTARFYTQDPSYSGFHRSFAMNGLPHPSFVFVMLGLSFVAGAFRYRSRVVGRVASVLVLAVLLFTALLFGAGY